RSDRSAPMAIAAGRLEHAEPAAAPVRERDAGTRESRARGVHGIGVARPALSAHDDRRSGGTARNLDAECKRRAAPTPHEDSDERQADVRPHRCAARAVADLAAYPASRN